MTSRDRQPKHPVRLETRPPASDSLGPAAPLLTAADVAALLQVSVRTVRRLIAAGFLDVIQIGRSVRIAPEALKAMLAAGRNKGG
jgi:excisionase family DNA binding protein